MLSNPLYIETNIDSIFTLCDNIYIIYGIGGTKMAFCMMCGNKLPDNAEFCPKCGIKINNEQAAQQPAAPESPSATNTDTVANSNPAQIYNSYPQNITTPAKKRTISKGAIIAIIISAVAVISTIVSLIVWAIVDAYYDNQYEGYTSIVSDNYEQDDEYVDTDSYAAKENDNAYEDESDDYVNNIQAMSAYAGEIVKGLADSDYYVDEGLYKSCAVLSDANADDIYELYLVYHKKTNGLVSAHYEVWSLEIGNERMLDSGKLYDEVGGNTGSLKLCANAGDIYVGIIKSTPEGDNINERADFKPLDSLGQPNKDAHGFAVTSSGSKKYYAMDGESVTYSKYKEEYNKYYTLCSLPDNPDDSALVMTFEEFITIYG